MPETKKREKMKHENIKYVKHLVGRTFILLPYNDINKWEGSALDNNDLSDYDYIYENNFVEPDECGYSAGSLRDMKFATIFSMSSSLEVFKSDSCWHIYDGLFFNESLTDFKLIQTEVTGSIGTVMTEGNYQLFDAAFSGSEALKFKEKCITLQLNNNVNQVSFIKSSFSGEAGEVLEIYGLKISHNLC